MKTRNVSLPMTASISVLLLLSALTAQGQAQWPMAGQNLSNSRSQPAEHSITRANVHTLSPKWVFTTTNDVSATPTVFNDAVYFPDWGGNLYAVNKETGTLIWSHLISDYDGAKGSISRVSPAVDPVNKQLIFGDNPIAGEGGAMRVNPSMLDPSNLKTSGANVIAVNQATGLLQWITKVSKHPASIITGSPVIFEGVVYIGVFSFERVLLHRNSKHIVVVHFVAA
jgi:polyvinyl alcohol dehydrogenase (cytochrome)